MDSIDDSSIREAPELVPPFLRVAVRVLRVVVVYQVCITDVFIKGFVKGGIGEEVGKSVARSHDCSW